MSDAHKVLTRCAWEGNSEFYEQFGSSWSGLGACPPRVVAVYGQTPVTSMTGFTQQSGGCAYNQKDMFYMKDYGAMPWLDCAKEASRRQLMMHAGYNQANVWGWAVLNPSRTNAQTGSWSTYQSAAIGGSLSCHLSRDKDSLAPPPPLAQYCGDSGIFGNLLCADGSLCDAGMNSANTQASNWNCCGVGNRAACMPGYIACNDLAGNGVDFSCHQSCASRGGNTCWLQADVDIGGAAIRWRYKDFGTQFHDQCMELASQAGASMTTPDTLGITWPSGTSYWIPSMMLCDLKSFMSASQSGTANSYDSGSGYTQSTSTVSCLAAFIEVELPPVPNYGQTPVTSIVISDGSYERPFCSWNSQCTWNAATQAVCAQKLCERSGYSTGSFVSSTGNMCSDDAGLSGHYWTTDSASFASGSPGVEAGITAECSS